MDSRLRAYAELNAPRYTSYPTAPHFNESVQAGEYARWLGMLAPETLLSLYLHIPYCQDICWYCGCNTFALQREEPLRAYVEALERELRQVAAATPARRVREIHWGGGTPNILSPAQFRSIFDQVRALFDLSALREHAIELDPRVLTPLHCVAYATVGVTRVSLGVQDLNPHVQAAMGRIQPLKTVAAAFAHLRAAGIAGISADLMYGLPRQSVADACASAREIAALAPNRIAVFGYAHVPWFKTRQRLIDESTLPDTDARIAQAQAIRETLIAAGYEAIGFDHFAKPDDSLARAARSGGLHRNFQGYVDDDCGALIGVGASAISTLPMGYAQNASDVTGWRSRLDESGFGTARGRALSAEDKVRRAVIERLLCDFAVDLRPFGGADAFRAEIARLTPLAADGLCDLDGDRIVIPEKAQPYARVVAQEFDAYRDLTGARHSRAV
ncbi:MAG TPA: oxygen-independent coproporphyrinogen III oxidase [Caulobacterales bacterium]|jgi:oxygen-independent coproporphyrinogen-3 oxidase|nr:oxygen-independent coproporphyrinogen III oxidase [Caulobacterales bacterium]